MKLQIVSDLHLEFNDNIAINNAGADILCLAGDICLAGQPVAAEYSRAT
jgi:predicted phosphodiesterase